MWYNILIVIESLIISSINRDLVTFFIQWSVYFSKLYKKPKSQMREHYVLYIDYVI